MAQDSNQEALGVSSADGDRFERLVADLSARFMTLDPGDLDAEIERSLAGIGHVLRVDRCFVFQLSEDGADYRVSHMWSGDRATPTDVVGLIVRERFPWLVDNIESRVDIIVPDSEALPEGAFREVQYCRELGIRSFLMCPMYSRDTVVGNLGIDLIGRSKDWTDKDVRRLRMLGEVIANAIVRGRKDQEIKRLRERLEAENSYLREEAKTQFDYDEIVGDSDAIKHALVEADGNDWVFGYNFGAMLELGPGTRVGATYASEMEPDFSGDLEIDPQGGPAFPTNSNVQFTFPQLVRVGVYHELNNRWALLGSAGREDWSEFDELLISTSAGTAAVPTEWRDTYHFGAGVHYRPAHDWLLQAGITYDTSPVSDANRTADLSIDRQIRYAIGAQHQWSERMTVGGAFEYIDLGEARINNPAVLQGEYETNRAFVIAVNLGYKF